VGTGVPGTRAPCPPLNPALVVVVVVVVVAAAAAAIGLIVSLSGINLESGIKSTTFP